MAIWKTKDGRELDVERMETRHIKNALAMLRRDNCGGWDELASIFSYMGSAPDGAYDAASTALHTLKYSPFVEIFRDELAKRGEKER